MSDFRENDPYLRARYGLGNRKKRWLIPAIITVVIGGGWLGWSAWFHIDDSVTTQVLSYSPISGQKIKVNYSYKVDPKSAHYACTFVALDQQSNVVGEINQTLPVGPSQGNASVIISTRIPAASANLDSCFALR